MVALHDYTKLRKKKKKKATSKIAVTAKQTKIMLQEGQKKEKPVLSLQALQSYPVAGYYQWQYCIY